MAKNILAIVLGLVTSLIIVFIQMVISHIIHPAPAGLDMKDMEAVKAFSDSAPRIVFVLLVLAYSIGSIVGGTVAAAVAVNNKMSKAITVGGILMGLGAYNLFMIPHPVWTIVISIFVFIPSSYLGGYLGIRISKK